MFLCHIWLCDVSDSDASGLNFQGRNNDIYLHHTAKSHTFYAHLAPSWMSEVGLVWFGLYMCNINRAWPHLMNGEKKKSWGDKCFIHEILKMVKICLTLISIHFALL